MVSTSPRRSIDTASWIADHDPIPITALRDGVVEAPRFDPRSEYVETYWLAVLGPSCVLAARRLADWLDVSPDGFAVELDAFARTLGLGTGTARNAPLIRTLTRLVDFGMATIDGASYAARTAFPPLGRRHIARLPGYLAARHARDVVELSATYCGARPGTVAR